MCISSPNVFRLQIPKDLFHLILPFRRLLAMTLDLDDVGACPHKKGTCYLNEDHRDAPDIFADGRDMQD